MLQGCRVRGRRCFESSMKAFARGWARLGGGLVVFWICDQLRESMAMRICTASGCG